MTQVYSNPSRENEPHALPDVEVFYFDGKRYCEGDVWTDEGDVWTDSDEGDVWTDSDGETLPAGWYYWFCFPGCIPEGDPVGPFATEQKAIEAAQAEAIFD